MTTVKITRQDKSIVAINCQGHSGFDQHGSDIVCAALSSIIQTAALGLMQVVGLQISFKKRDDIGSLQFTLPSLDAVQRRDADMILDTMLIGVDNLYDSYSDFIELIFD
jgi:uncharacterized protein YsxB (DUF464 family)